MSQMRSGRWDLGGSELTVNEMKLDSATRFGEIELAMNVKPVNLTVCTSWVFSSFCVPKPNRIVANRIKNFGLQFTSRVRNFPHKNVTSFANYMIASCPDLEKLFVQINYDFLILHEFMQWIKELNEILKKGTLKDLETNGRELIIGVKAYIGRQPLKDAIANGHEIMKFGEPCNNEWMDDRSAVLARQVKNKEKVLIRYRFMG